MGSLNGVIEEFCGHCSYPGEAKRLQAIVDKLPKTADGVPVVPGMEVWDLSKPNSFPSKVNGVSAPGVGWYECRYSTREAAEGECQKAIEQADREAAEAAVGEVRIVPAPPGLIEAGQKVTREAAAAEEGRKNATAKRC